MRLTYRHDYPSPAEFARIRSACGVWVSLDDMGGQPQNHAELLRIVAVVQALPLCPLCIAVLPLSGHRRLSRDR